jgi:hypothetical protein
MKHSARRANGKDGVALIEEACVTLRHCPPGILMWYLLGTGPGLAGLLVFWSNTCQDPFARENLVERALAAAALFVWMKFFQARFGTELLAHLAGDPPPRWSLLSALRSLTNQIVLTALGVIALPLALLTALPFPWIYAFFQNVSALDSGTTGLRDLVRSAAAQARLWPAQNHIMLLILSVFGFVILLNWGSLFFVLPSLLRMFFGVESVFTQNPYAILNTTSLAFLTALSYLTLDPLLKTCYILRCFHGESLGTGADLRVELRRFATAGRTALLLALLALSPVAVRAESAAPTPTGPVTAEKLDTAISRIAQGEKYTWRRPAERPEQQDGVIAGFLRKVREALRGFSAKIRDFVQRAIDWIYGRRDRSTDRANADWMTPQLGLLFLVLAVVASLLAVAIPRFLKARRQRLTADAVVLPVMPDLRNEQTAADALPEEEWLRLGQSLVDRGEYRLAVRAFYLGSLAHLASRGLVTIARHKSNREYQNELRRRAHAVPDLADRFRENVQVIDGVWYGHREADADTVRDFVANFHRLRAR